MPRGTEHEPRRSYCPTCRAFYGPEDQARHFGCGVQAMSVSDPMREYLDLIAKADEFLRTKAENQVSWSQADLDFLRGAKISPA